MEILEITTYGGRGVSKRRALAFDTKEEIIEWLKAKNDELRSHGRWLVRQDLEYTEEWREGNHPLDYPWCDEGGAGAGAANTFYLYRGCLDSSLELGKVNQVLHLITSPHRSPPTLCFLSGEETREEPITFVRARLCTKHWMVDSDKDRLFKSLSYFGYRNRSVLGEIYYKGETPAWVKPLYRSDLENIGVTPKQFAEFCVSLMAHPLSVLYKPHWRKNKLQEL